ncbi:MAG: putative Dynein heavy chain, partial [Streblomastix strix]
MIRRKKGIEDILRQQNLVNPTELTQRLYSGGYILRNQGQAKFPSGIPQHPVNNNADKPLTVNIAIRPGTRSARSKSQSPFPQDQIPPSSLQQTSQQQRSFSPSNTQGRNSTKIPPRYPGMNSTFEATFITKPPSPNMRKSVDASFMRDNHIGEDSTQLAPVTRVGTAGNYIPQPLRQKMAMLAAASASGSATQQMRNSINFPVKPNDRKGQGIITAALFSQVNQQTNVDKDKEQKEKKEVDIEKSKTGDIGRETNNGSILTFLERLYQQQKPSLEFVYCKIAAGPYDVFNPYDMCIISHEQKDPKSFFTASAQGITHYYGLESEYCNMSKWLNERRLFNLVSNMPMFRDFRLWRCYAAWESYARRRRVAKSNQLLTIAHFLSSRPLHKTLVTVKAACLRFRKTPMFRTDEKKTYRLDEFQEEMDKQSEKFREKLLKFEEEIEDLVKNACLEVLRDKGFYDKAAAIESIFIDKDRPLTRGGDKQDLDKSEDNNDDEYNDQESNQEERKRKQKGDESDARNSSSARHVTFHQQGQQQQQQMNNTTQQKQQQNQQINAPSQQQNMSISGGSVSIIKANMSLGQQAAALIGGPRKDQQAHKEEGMSYTRMAEKRLEYKRLTSFIRTCDYIVMDVQHHLIVQATSDLLSTLRRRTRRERPSIPQLPALDRVRQQRAVRRALSKATNAMMRGKKSKKQISGLDQQDDQQQEDEDKLNLDEYGDENLETVLPPLFETELLIEDDHLHLAHNGDDFDGSGNDMGQGQGGDDEKKEQTQQMQGEQEQEGEGGQGDDDDEEEAGESVATILGERLQQDKQLIELKLDVGRTLLNGFSTVIEHATKFRPFLKIYLANKVVDGHEIRIRDPPTNWFAEALDNHTAQLSDATNLPDHYEVGMFNILVVSLKDAVAKSATECITMMHELLPDIAAEKRGSHANEVRDAFQVMSTTPENVEQYASYLEAVTQIQGNQIQLRHNYDTVEAFYQLIRDYSIEISNADQANLQLMEKGMSQLSSLTMNTEATLDEQTQKFNSQLSAQIKDMKKEISQLKSEIEEPHLLINPQDMDANLQEIDKILEKITQKREEADKSQSYQKLFNASQEKWEDLAEVEKVVKQKKLLWQSLVDWTNKVIEWKGQPLMEMNRDSVQASFIKYLKVAGQLERDMEPNVVLQHLRQKIKEFEGTMPIIEALKNVDLKTHHWMRIRDTISGSSAPWDQNFTLGWLLDQGVMDKKIEIAQISEEASSEAVLTDMLHKIIEKWTVLEVKTKPFRNESFLLVEVDELLREYDDSQVTLETIKGSRFAAPIKEQVDFWASRLATFNEVLEQWLQFQQKWIALEPVFQSDELLKDFVKKFHECNKFWHEFMRRTHEFPGALRASQQPGLASIFKQHNSTLDQIQVALNGLLNTKRAAFGRFFFLPNDDLLEILKEGKNPINVMPYMNKLFDNIKTLEFTSMDDLRKIEVVAMVSSEGESVPFGEEKVNPRSKPVEVWLRMVETSMFKTLHSLLRQAVKKLFEIVNKPPAKKHRDADKDENALLATTNARQQWILQTKAQLAIAGAQILWVSQMEQALSNDKPQDELKKMIQKCEQQLDLLTDLARGRLEPLQSVSVGALIVIEVHARDIVDELNRDNVISAQDFDWAKRLRYYWDQKEDTCMIRQTNSSFKYGFEYLGCTPRLVITPLTDQCYITLTSALHLKLGGAPAGPAGT